MALRKGGKIFCFWRDDLPDMADHQVGELSFLAFQAVEFSSLVGEFQDNIEALDFYFVVCGHFNCIEFDYFQKWALMH